MKPMIRYHFLCLLIVLLTSCIEDVRLSNQDETEREVILSCILKNSDIQELRLYYPRYLYEEPIPNIEMRAEVNLYIHPDGFGGDSLLVGGFVHSDSLLWHLKYTPEPGRGYSIVANVDDKELYAKTSMPDSINRSEIYGNPLIHSSELDLYKYAPSLGVLRFFSSVDCDKNHFIWVYGTDKYTNIVPDIFTTYPYADPFSRTDKYIKLYHTETDIKPYYYYQNYIRIETDDGGMSFMDENPFIFLGLSKKYFNGKLSGLYCIFSSESEELETITIMNVSKEYDKYLKNRAMTSLSEDFSMLFDRNNPYSNVSNKFGIFGAAYIISSPPDKFHYWTSTPKPWSI